MGNYAGVDSASEKHDVLICDEAGDELLTATFAHDEAGLGGLCRALQRAKVELVAVERPDGVLIDRLLDAGLRVLALHPNQVAAARPRFRTSGGKSDRFDAFVLCELARTDHHRFRVLEPDTDETKALRVFTRAREDLVQARVALGNQLRGELERFWPGPIGLFSDLDSPIGLAFLQRYPSPSDARGLAEQRLTAFLDRHHYTGRKQPSDLLAKLKSAPEGRAGEQEIKARRAVVLTLIAAIGQLAAQINSLERQITHAIREHPDGQIFLSLFRRAGSVICAATMLSEMGDSRARYSHRDASRPTVVRLRWPRSPASASRRSSAGREQTAAQRAPARSRTAAANGIPGPPSATPQLEPAATTAAARCAPSGAPGPASSGAAGPTAPGMTLSDTPGCSNASRSLFLARRGPVPTSLPPSGCSAPPSPARRPAGPSAKVLGHHRWCLDQPPGEGLKRLPLRRALSRPAPPGGW